MDKTLYDEEKLEERMITKQEYGKKVTPKP